MMFDAVRHAIDDALRRAMRLLALGDTRFPFLSFKFPGDEYAEDDIRTPSAKHLVGDACRRC
jgi:hypothetical protein